MESINRRIARYRKFKGYTCADFAEALNMTQKTYSSKENGTKIDCELLIKIAELLKVDVKILLYGDEEDSPPDFKNQFEATKKEENLILMLRSFNAKKRDEYVKMIYNDFIKK